VPIRSQLCLGRRDVRQIHLPLVPSHARSLDAKEQPDIVIGARYVPKVADCMAHSGKLLRELALRNEPQFPVLTVLPKKELLAWVLGALKSLKG
jgi:hypothetical protein